MAVTRRRMHPLQKFLFVLCTILFLIAFVSSVVQMGIILFGDEISPYIRAQPDQQNTDLPQQRGTFVRQDGAFYEVLGFEIAAPELLQKTVRVPQESMDGVFVYRAAVEGQENFLLYRVPLDDLNAAIQANATGDAQAWSHLNDIAQTVPVHVERIGKTTVVHMDLANGSWEPGGYMLRLPAEGTGMGTFWYYFVVV